MLAADKLLLQSNVKQRAIQLREKELNLFNDNFNAVGTQSAVLAGFAMTSFAEIDLPHNAFYAQKACLHLFVTISICANLMCTASTTFVSVWGSGKALRGKDGSMARRSAPTPRPHAARRPAAGRPRPRAHATPARAHARRSRALPPGGGAQDKAVDGMHAERAFIFACFGVGLINTLLALMSAAWILMTFEVALVATLGISWSIYIIIRQARRIYSKFGLSQEDVVRFDDIISNAPRVEQDDDGESSVLIPRSTSGRARGTYDV